MHASTDCDYTRPISLDQIDKSTPLFPTDICLFSTYQPTYQFIVVTQFLGLRERAGQLWHSPTTTEFMGQCLPNLAPPATASSCSFQNKPSHKVASISFPGRGRGDLLQMVPKKLRLQVCVCVFLNRLKKAKESPRDCQQKAFWQRAQRGSYINSLLVKQDMWPQEKRMS